MPSRLLASLLAVCVTFSLLAYTGDFATRRQVAARRRLKDEKKAMAASDPRTIREEEERMQMAGCDPKIIDAAMKKERKKAKKERMLLEKKRKVSEERREKLQLFRADAILSQREEKEKEKEARWDLVGLFEPLEGKEVPESVFSHVKKLGGPAPDCWTDKSSTPLPSVCSGKAVAKWKNLNGKGCVWMTCVGCQEVDFGGWPR